MEVFTPVKFFRLSTLKSIRIDQKNFFEKRGGGPPPFLKTLYLSTGMEVFTAVKFFRLSALKSIRIDQKIFSKKGGGAPLFFDRKKGGDLPLFGKLYISVQEWKFSLR